MTYNHSRWGCPAVFYSEERNSYIIIGKKVNPSKFGISERVMDDEDIIEISEELIERSIQNQSVT